MRKYVYPFVLALLLCTLGACSGEAPSNSAVDSNVAVTAPAIEAGKATVVGRVFSTRSNKPMTTGVRLAEVIRQNGEAIFVLDGAQSPGATTQEDGTFVIPNIEAREYVVVVGDVDGEYVIISEGENKARVWSAKPDDITNLGELRVNL
jgi:hypothetical protein